MALETFRFDPFARVQDALELANKVLDLLPEEEPEVALAAVIAAVAALSASDTYCGTPEEVWRKLWQKHVWLFRNARFVAQEHRALVRVMRGE